MACVHVWLCARVGITCCFACLLACHYFFNMNIFFFSADMVAYWHAFHVYGDPNKATQSLPTWPLYAGDVPAESILTFEVNREYVPVVPFNRLMCSTWENVLA